MVPGNADVEKKIVFIVSASRSTEIFFALLIQGDEKGSECLSFSKNKSWILFILRLDVYEIMQICYT